MTTARSEAEPVTLRKLAQELARARKERTTTVHLLAAIAGREGAAGELLRERRLDGETLLKASRSFDEDGDDPIARLSATARDVAKRSQASEPTALHLLVALLADRRAAAYRALESSGVDLARLRTAAMQLVLGVVAARRVPSSLERSDGRDGRPGARPGPRHEDGPASQRGLSPVRPVPAQPTLRSAPGPAQPAARPSSPPPAHRPSSPPPAVAVPLTPTPRRLEGEPAADRGPDSERPEPRSQPPGRAPVAPPRPARRGEAPARRAASPLRTPPLRGRGGASDTRAVDAPALALDPASFPVLARLGQNLTLAAAEGRLERVVGREAEIERIIDVLGKRHASSACLVGPAGVGKTAVARGVARRLLEIDRESGVSPRVVVELSVSELVAGTGTRGALAERLAAIRTEIREAADRIVLFIDELHELFGGIADEATAELKLALSRGELSLVGATGTADYRRSIESDPALARRFTLVEIEEPGEADAFLLLQVVGESLAAHHGVRIDDEAIASAVSWSIRYLPGRALPDKAVAILDLAGARARRRPGPGQPVVGRAEVAEVVAELGDLPVERLLETDKERMLALETHLAERVVGHQPALARIAAVLRRNAAGLRGRRPIGTFLLLGPTGVGKTETAKAIAEALFHSPDAMTRLDLSEYAESHAVARLVGAPPGYVGYEAGGQLTEAVRRRPYQVVLLDEIEKAHRDVLEAFLQVFDEGRLTDGRGHRVDFTNTVLVLTSNLGAREAGDARAAKAVGFSSAPKSEARAEARAADAMLAVVRSELPPELYNRIDEVLCMAALTREEVAEIARRLLDGLRETLEARGARLSVDESAVEALLVHGFDPLLGARPMKRAIGRLVEAPLAELILRDELPAGAVAWVTAGDSPGEVVVDVVPGRTAARRRAMA